MDIFLLPLGLIVLLVPMHVWFGREILKRGVVFTDLSIAQAAALGNALSVSYLAGEYSGWISMGMALCTGMVIAWSMGRKIHLEALIGLIYILGSSSIFMVLAYSGEGTEHMKSLMANEILFVSSDDLLKTLEIYLGVAAVLKTLYSKASGYKREMIFFMSLALTVTVSVELVGVFVVFVWLVAPIFLGLIQKKFPPYLFAVVFGWGFSCFGLWWAFMMDMPTGFSIAFFVSLISVAGALFLSVKSDR